MFARRRAYSTLWWIGFLSFCLVPLATLALGLGRYFNARAEMYKAADGAALAAAAEVDLAVYRATGRIEFLPSALGVAQAYAAWGSDYLVARRIVPRVTGLWLDPARHTVHVRLEADASSLFPSVLRGLVVTGEGEAEARIRRQ